MQITEYLSAWWNRSTKSPDSTSAAASVVAVRGQSLGGYSETKSEPKLTRQTHSSVSLTLDAELYAEAENDHLNHFDVVYDSPDVVASNCALGWGLRTEDNYGFVVPPRCAPLFDAAKAQYAMSNQRSSERWLDLMQQMSGETRLSRADLCSRLLQENPETARRLIRAGVPFEYRRYMWQLCCGAREKIEANSGAYETLLQTFAQQESSAMRRIDKDLSRTFPGHPLFESTLGREKLRRLLVAYSWFNTSVGYCQSLNFVAGMLLLFMEEEECFWMLQTIADNVFAEYYTPGMLGLHIDLKLLHCLLQIHCSSVASHLKALDTDLNMIGMRWLLCLGIGCFPTELTVRVLDLTFLDGPIIILRIVLALVIQAQDAILKVTDAADVLRILDNAGMCAFDVEHTLQAAMALNLPPMQQLATMRMQFRTDILKSCQSDPTQYRL